MSKIRNMKEVIIKVKFNDVDGYIGHGDDVIELIKEIVSTEIEISLVDDKVIKDDFTVEVISN